MREYVVLFLVAAVVTWLLGVLARHPAPTPRFESAAATREAMRRELGDSRRAVEDVLGAPVAHFCFPWNVASAAGARLAREAGYRVVHLGETNGLRGVRGGPLALTRVREEYLLRLPGDGRESWRATLAAHRRRRGGS